MKTSLAILFLLALAGGCVMVGRHGVYSRTEVVDQVGSNRVTKIEIAPKP